MKVVGCLANQLAKQLLQLGPTLRYKDGFAQTCAQSLNLPFWLAFLKVPPRSPRPNRAFILTSAPHAIGDFLTCQAMRQACPHAKSKSICYAQTLGVQQRERGEATPLSGHSVQKGT